MKYSLLTFIVSSALILTGCGGQAEADSRRAPTDGELRDNTPVALEPKADGQTLYSGETAQIDASHSGDGYICVRYTGENPKVKLQITNATTASRTYTYNMPDGAEYAVLPLSEGSGTYSVNLYENLAGSSYTLAFSQEIEAQIQDELRPFLYPNYYVNFNAACETVAKGAELCEGAGSELDAVKRIFDYVTETISYDHEKAASVESGYIPDVDEILKKQTGICFDYAAVMASMLRTQRIPTKLVVGYRGEEYHAWLSIYTEESGWIEKLIFFDGQDWTMADPTLAAGDRRGYSKKTSQDGLYNDMYYY